MLSSSTHRCGLHTCSFRSEGSEPAANVCSVSVHPDCISLFNELKLGKDIKWIVYKFSDDGKEIVVEESSKDPDWSGFREKLLQAKSKDARGNEVLGGRYAVFDVEYDLPGGDGKRYASP